MHRNLLGLEFRSVIQLLLKDQLGVGHLPLFHAAHILLSLDNLGMGFVGQITIPGEHSLPKLYFLKLVEPRTRDFLVLLNGLL